MGNVNWEGQYVLCHLRRDSYTMSTDPKSFCKTPGNVCSKDLKTGSPWHQDTNYAHSQDHSEGGACINTVRYVSFYCCFEMYGANKWLNVVYMYIYTLYIYIYICVILIKTCKTIWKKRGSRLWRWGYINCPSVDWRQWCAQQNKKTIFNGHLYITSLAGARDGRNFTK